MRSFLKAAKKRLMFTGGLQYLPTIVASVFLFVIYFILEALSLKIVSDVILVLAILSTAIALFDLVTVKYNIMPKEKSPERRDGMNAFDNMM